MKKKLFLTFIILNIFTNSALADFVDDTFDFNNNEIVGFSSVSTTDDSRSILINPGAIGLRNGIDAFISSTVASDFKQFNIAGMYESFNGGFQYFEPKNSNLPKLNKFFGGIAYPIIQGFSVGVSYSNAQDASDSQISAQSIDIGLITRPMEFLSLGIVGKNLNNPMINKAKLLNSTEKTKISRAYLVSVALRPPIKGFTDRITLTSDAEWVEGSDIKRARIKFGINTEIINGVILDGFALSDLNLKKFAFGFQCGIALPYLTMGYTRSFDNVTKDSAYLRFTSSKERNFVEGENFREE